MDIQKHTKIVATIGPATESEKVLAEMMRAGMNVARFNTKHSTPQWHNSRMQRAKKVASEQGFTIANLLDLQGPEIRIDLPDEKPFAVKKGEAAHFTSDIKSSKKNRVFVPSHVIESLSVGDQILLEDGACEFVVASKTEDTLVAEAVIPCEVKHRKTMNTPGVILDMPSLTDRDYTYLDGVDPSLIDYVGLSFVRDSVDIKVLQSELNKRSISALIISKIENQAAIDNIDEIIEVSDAIMVARGDLGVEVPYEQLIQWQKTIIHKCRVAAKPVITATQMLKSMVENPTPTRAEVSDIANAIYDGTDAVMLSEESTIGEHPVKAVSVQAKIAAYNEKLVEYKRICNSKHSTAQEAVSFAAHTLMSLESMTIDKVVCLTETGKTARLLSRFRDVAPIFAVTSNQKTKNALALVFGVESIVVKIDQKKIDDIGIIIEKCQKRDIIKPGETILLVYGDFWKNPGLTNTLRVVTIE